ncbi:MAG: hypothetical protein IKF42_02600 [Mogibacterium sp.]|nr:hypothetical protein [Mogibacterium sp.]
MARIWILCIRKDRKMTSIANPDYRFYKMLEGTWKDEKGICEAVLNSGAGIEIRYAAGKLAAAYSVMETNKLMLNQGAAGMMMPVTTYTFHEGEELKITLNNRVVYEGDKTVYRVSEAWYGNDKLNLEMMDLYDGHTENVVLSRVIEKEEPLAKGEIKCACGYRGPARRFCPNCGNEI